MIPDPNAPANSVKDPTTISLNVSVSIAQTYRLGDAIVLLNRSGVRAWEVGKLAVMFQTDSHMYFADQPDPGSRLWRYMDLPKFLSLLEDSALYFARADQIVDGWEGATGPYNAQMRPL
ncbi:hypothetical protein J2790_003933 [Paenarthrobacter nicotinovorans]|nr:hypothetical protein [Paenarthrobacter nicotinovorans]